MFIDKFFSRTLYDLFVEFVEYVRAVVSMGNLHPSTNANVPDLIEASPTQAVNMNSAIDEMLISNDPATWFIKLVEDCLRKFPDSIVLGQSRLVDYVGVKGENQVERGKQLQRLLYDAIESLRPSGMRPVGSLPRAWYNYVVLHDAYVEDVRNNEVMARLYISEGTFNRTRRLALRGVTMWLIEGMRQKRNIN
jgi:hypothetical protein